MMRRLKPIFQWIFLALVLVYAIHWPSDRVTAERLANFKNVSRTGYISGRGNIELSVSEQSQSNWLIETIDDFGQQNSPDASIGQLPNGEIVIAYISRQSNVELLKLAIRMQAGWVIETIDTSAGVIHSAELAVAADGTIRVAYDYDSGPTDELRIATKTPTGWQIEVVDGEATNGAGATTSLVLDSSGLARISYYRNLPYLDLRLATETATGWQLETVVLSDGLHGSTMALGNDGYVRLAYDNFVTNELYLATETATIWQYDNLAGNNLWEPSLALTANDEARILYKETNNNLLKYARQITGGWQIETVVSDAVNQDSRLRLAATDQAHIIYSSTAGNLIYGVEALTGWQFETVEATFPASPPRPNALLLAAANQPHLVYEAGSSLKYATIPGPDFLLTVEPAQAEACVDSDAIYTVEVGSQSGYTQTVTLSADGEPDPPGSAVFNPNNQAAPYMGTLTIGTTAATAGSYPVIISGIGPTQTHTTTVLLNVDSAIPGTPTLMVPPDGATGISPLPTFKWTAVVDASQYFLEVASDPAFNTVVYTATVLAPETTHTTAPPLDPDSVYYWRVFAANACGNVVSEVFSFDTGPTFCVSPDIPITSGPHISDLVITNTRTISDMNVLLNISHTWVGDLIVELEHLETGTTLTLVDQPGYPNINPTDGCRDNDLVDFILDDESANGPHDDACPDTDITPAYPAGSAWDPVETSLGNFDVEDISGTWRLSITDEYPPADNGVLNEWCIIPTLEPKAPNINVGPASLSSEQYSNTLVTHTLTISNTGNANLEWDIFEDATSAIACDGSEPIDWVSVSPISGTLPASSEASVAVVFGSAGYPAGIYPGTLCISSNDGTNPMIPVPLTMTVSLNRTYLPIVVSGSPAAASPVPYLVSLLMLPVAISLVGYWSAAEKIRWLSQNSTQIPDPNGSLPP